MINFIKQRSELDLSHLSDSKNPSLLIKNLPKYIKLIFGYMILQSKGKELTGASKRRYILHGYLKNKTGNKNEQNKEKT